MAGSTGSSDSGASGLADFVGAFASDSDDGDLFFAAAEPEPRMCTPPPREPRRPQHQQQLATSPGSEASGALAEQSWLDGLNQAVHALDQPATEDEEEEEEEEEGGHQPQLLQQHQRQMPGQDRHEMSDSYAATAAASSDDGCSIEGRYARATNILPADAAHVRYIEGATSQLGCMAHSAAAPIKYHQCHRRSGCVCQMRARCSQVRPSTVWPSGLTRRTSSGIPCCWSAQHPASTVSDPAPTRALLTATGRPLQVPNLLTPAECTGLVADVEARHEAELAADVDPGAYREGGGRQYCIADMSSRTQRLYDEILVRKPGSGTRSYAPHSFQPSASLPLSRRPPRAQRWWPCTNVSACSLRGNVCCRSSAGSCLKWRCVATVEHTCRRSPCANGDPAGLGAAAAAAAARG